jgi:hypothetical protein
MDSQIKIFIHFENFLPNLIFLIDKNIQLFKHQSLKQFPLLSNIFCRRTKKDVLFQIRN